MPEKRTCGGCTACCKTHSVLSLNKKRGVLCQHCNIGKGCKIYSDRPSECKEFRCEWLEGRSIQLQHRPDRVGVVVDYYPIEEIGMNIASLWEVFEGALDKEFAQKITRELLEGGIVAVMHVYLNGRKVFYVKR